MERTYKNRIYVTSEGEAYVKVDDLLSHPIVLELLDELSELESILF